MRIHANLLAVRLSGPAPQADTCAPSQSSTAATSVTTPTSAASTIRTLVGAVFRLDSVRQPTNGIGPRPRPNRFCINRIDALAVARLVDGTSPCTAL